MAYELKDWGVGPSTDYDKQPNLPVSCYKGTLKCFRKRRIGHVYQVGGIIDSLISNESIHGIVQQSRRFQQSLGRADKTESFQERCLFAFWLR
jgi:hypothetical protein